jgi:hypothetical protein
MFGAKFFVRHLPILPNIDVKFQKLHEILENSLKSLKTGLKTDRNK